MPDIRSIPEHTITKMVHVNASPTQVWTVLTEPEMMKRWMSDEEMDIQVNWQVGGAIFIRGDLHGMKYENKGTVLQFQADEVLQYNFWSTLSELPDEPDFYSGITFELEPVQDGINLTMTQDNLRAYAMRKHWEFYWKVTLPIIRDLAENVQTF